MIKEIAFGPLICATPRYRPLLASHALRFEMRTLGLYSTYITYTYVYVYMYIIWTLRASIGLYGAVMCISRTTYYTLLFVYMNGRQFPLFIFQ